MTCIKCQHGTAKRFGTYGSKRIQRYRCKTCKATFAEPRTKPLGGHYTDLDKAAQMVSLLTEGVGIRATSRLTGLHKTTILSLLLTMGENCRHLFDGRVRNLRPRFVQADELWTFVHTKEHRLFADSPREWGDAYIWVALDSETKLILSYYVGKRDPMSAYEFVRDLSTRIRGRFQLTTDGLRTYIPAVEEYFGADVDFAQLIKHYRAADSKAPDWYRSSDVVSVVPTPISGNPKLGRISTATSNVPI